MEGQMLFNRAIFDPESKEWRNQRTDDEESDARPVTGARKLGYANAVRASHPHSNAVHQYTSH